MNYVSPEYLKNDNKDLTKLEWEKCKLVLVKCAGGYMLEFHSLDKTPKVSEKTMSANFFKLTYAKISDAQRHILLLNKRGT